MTINITVTGYVGQDPLLHHSRAGVAWTSARIVTMRRESYSDSIDTDIQCFTARAYDDRACNVVASLKQGTPVIVTGELVTEEYTYRTSCPHGNCSYIECPDAEEQQRENNVIRNATFAVDITRGTVIYQPINHALCAECTDPDLEDFGSDQDKAESVNQIMQLLQPVT